MSFWDKLFNKEKVDDFVDNITDFLKDIFKLDDKDDEGDEGDGGGSDVIDPTERLQAAMITPIFVNKNSNNVRSIVQQLKSSSDFNSVCGLVDLQRGRRYIFDGRSSTKLESKTKKNIQICIDEGIRPVVIIRNDWATRKNSAGSNYYVPSVGGISNNNNFYKNNKLSNEKEFVLNLFKEFENKIDIQLNIEPDDVRSAQFGITLGEYIREIGFKGRIITNPLGRANVAFESLKAQMNKHDIIFARSRNNDDFGNDPIINTDGNLNVNSGNAKSYIDRMNQKNSEDGWILWSKELSNVSTKIPDGYIRKKSNPQPEPDDGFVDTGRGGRYDYPPEKGSTVFLWKPVSESTGSVFALTTYERWLETKKVYVGKLNAQGLFSLLENFKWHRSSEPGVNGWRLHWKGNKPGSGYSAPIWLREETFDGRIFEYYLPNPALRYEYDGGGQQVRSNSLNNEIISIDLTKYNVEKFSDPEMEKL